MIINHPILNRFSPSIKEVFPQTDDDKVVVPNIFNLNGLPPEPLQIQGGGTGQVAESSIATGTSLTVANSGPTSVLLAQIRPGWWRLRATGCYSANYVSTNQGGDFLVFLQSATQTYQMITLYAAVGTQSFNVEIEVMIPNTTNAGNIHQFSMQLGVNGVGNTHQVSCHILCNKLL
jgi:hypothetical protein